MWRERILGSSGIGAFSGIRRTNGVALIDVCARFRVPRRRVARGGAPRPRGPCHGTYPFIAQGDTARAAPPQEPRPAQQPTIFAGTAASPLRQQQEAISYLREENRILREKLGTERILWRRSQSRDAGSHPTGGKESMGS